MKIILGSQSFGRKKVLEDAGYTFDVLIADIDEKAIRSDDFEQLPLLIARAKADALIPKIHEPALLITSDQVVLYNGELREKPESTQQAIQYLESYYQYPAQTHTAIVVTNTVTGKQAEAVDTALAYFKKIPSSVIDTVVQEGLVMHTAGGFIVEHPLLQPYIDYIEGDINSITGLPLQLTEELLKEVQS